jgi:hypothetical protein
MTLSSYNVGMSVSTDDTASEAVVRQDHLGVALSMSSPSRKTQWLLKGVTLAGFPGKMEGL